MNLSTFSYDNNLQLLVNDRNVSVAHAMRPHFLDSHTHKQFSGLPFPFWWEIMAKGERKDFLCVCNVWFVYSSEANRYFHKHIVEKKFWNCLSVIMKCGHIFWCGRWFFVRLFSSWMDGEEWLFFAMNYLKTILKQEKNVPFEMDSIRTITPMKRSKQVHSIFSANRKQAKCFFMQHIFLCSVTFPWHINCGERQVYSNNSVWHFVFVKHPNNGIQH